MHGSKEDDGWYRSKLVGHIGKKNNSHIHDKQRYIFSAIVNIKGWIDNRPNDSKPGQNMVMINAEDS